jgi:hypothetical protein
LTEILTVWTQNAQFYNKKGRNLRAASHRDLHAPKRLFFRNTALKIHGRRQPCRGFSSCLAEKSLALECFAVLKVRFFLTGNSEDEEILVVFQGRWIFCGEKDSFKTV